MDKKTKNQPSLPRNRLQAGYTMMQIYPALLLVLALLAGITFSVVSDEMILQAPGVEEQITSGAGNDVTPRIDGNYITWVSWVYGDADVFYYSIDGKLEEKVTSAPGNQINPDISGNHIVWEDDRNGKASVWVYDITTRAEAHVGSTGFYQRNPAVSGSTIVWEDYRNTMDSDIYRYVLGQSKEYPVCTAAGRQINPEISGNYIVWEDYRHCSPQYSENSDIYLYNIETGVETQVTRDVSAQKNPRIDGNIIVWEDWRNTQVDIYSTEISTLVENRVTFDTCDDTEPDISESIITWTRSDSHGKKDIYMINLQSTVTNIVCASYGDQTCSAISVDRVVWQDDRSGVNNNDIYLYTLVEETPYPPYQFHGNCLIEGQPAPAGTEIIAKVGTTQVGSTTTRTVGQYGTGGYDRRLIVPVTQAMLGKTITFYSDNLKAEETVLVTEQGGIYPLDLSFIYTAPIQPAEFYGSVTIDGVPAFAGTVITATIDGEQRGEYTTREVGRYGGPASTDPRLKVQLYSDDIGKTILFWVDGMRADNSFIVEKGGIFNLDLTVNQYPVITDYEFYGTAFIEYSPAPVGTVISALIDGQERGRITTTVEGAYGGPGVYDTRLVVPVTGADGGKTIYFWSEGLIANEVEVIPEVIPVTRDLVILLQKDLTFTGSSGIMANFVGTPLSGDAPLTVSFTDLSTGYPTMWHWDFGDGQTEGMLGSPTHTYTDVGTYTVSLTASNQYGQSDIEIKPDYIHVGTVPSEYYISLYPGWNCVSTPRWLAEGHNTAAIFSGVDVDGHSIYCYDAEKGLFTTLSTQSQIVPLDAIWIYSAKTDRVYLTFEQNYGLLPEKTLFKGWNSVGFTGLEPAPAKTTFASVANAWVYCLVYDPIEQNYQQTIVKDHNDTTALTPYQGYWLFMNENGLLTGLSG